MRLYSDLMFNSDPCLYDIANDDARNVSLGNLEGNNGHTQYVADEEGLSEDMPLPHTRVAQSTVKNVLLVSSGILLGGVGHKIYNDTVTKEPYDIPQTTIDRIERWSGPGDSSQQPDPTDNTDTTETVSIPIFCLNLLSLIFVYM